MAGNLTLAMIKPHAVRNRQCGEIINMIEKNGFGILLVKSVQLRQEGAEEFYKEHQGKDFFPKLTKTMASGPIWVMVLAKTNAVEQWRNLMGATDPTEAEEGTVRKKYGEHTNITNNAVHGSATDHDAKREINFFFGREIKLADRVLQEEGH